MEDCSRGTGGGSSYGLDRDKCPGSQRLCLYAVTSRELGFTRNRLWVFDHPYARLFPLLPSPASTPPPPTPRIGFAQWATVSAWSKQPSPSSSSPLPPLTAILAVGDVVPLALAWLASSQAHPVGVPAGDDKEDGSDCHRQRVEAMESRPLAVPGYSSSKSSETRSITSTSSSSSSIAAAESAATTSSLGGRTGSDAGVQSALTQSSILAFFQLLALLLSSILRSLLSSLTLRRPHPHSHPPSLPYAFMSTAKSEFYLRDDRGALLQSQAPDPGAPLCRENDVMVA